MKDISKPNFLKLVPIFSPLFPRELEELNKITENRTYRKDSPFFLKDDVGTYLFIIKKGSCKVVVEHERGKEIILAILYPGDIFGEMSLLDGKPRSATVIAREHCDVLLISRSRFLNFLKTYPSISIKILEAISERLRKTDQQVRILNFISAESRVAQLFLNLSSEYGLKRGDSMFLDIKLTQEEIAEMCGIRRETVNRVIMRFKKEGLIKMEGKNIVVNKGALYEKICREGKGKDERISLL